MGSVVGLDGVCCTVVFDMLHLRASPSPRLRQLRMGIGDANISRPRDVSMVGEPQESTDTLHRSTDLTRNPVLASTGEYALSLVIRSLPDDLSSPVSYAAHASSQTPAVLPASTKLRIVD